MLRRCIWSAVWTSLIIVCSGSPFAAHAGSILLDAPRTASPSALPALSAMDRCWVETAGPLPKQSAAPQRRVSAKKHLGPPPHRRHRRVVRRARRAASIWVPKPESRVSLVWNCAWPISPPPPLTIEPFITDFADIMSTTRGDDLLQQWIIDRDMPRHRRRSMPPAVSIAPEPETWGLLLIGFGLIGMALRRARSARYCGNYQWRDAGAAGDERLATTARRRPLQGTIACRSAI